MLKIDILSLNLCNRGIFFKGYFAAYSIYPDAFLKLNHNEVILTFNMTIWVMYPLKNDHKFCVMKKKTRLRIRGKTI